MVILLYSVCFSRKNDLRELKLLQKVENHQYQELVFRAKYLREQQDKKFDQETQTLLRYCIRIGNQDSLMLLVTFPSK